MEMSNQIIEIEIVLKLSNFIHFRMTMYIYIYVIMYIYIYIYYLYISMYIFDSANQLLNVFCPVSDLALDLHLSFSTNQDHI